jgi:hypothetical protein
LKHGDSRPNNGVSARPKSSTSSSVLNQASVIRSPSIDLGQAQGAAGEEREGPVTAAESDITAANSISITNTTLKEDLLTVVDSGVVITRYSGRGVTSY